MKILNKIRAALDTRLLSTPGIPACAMPNVDFAPTTDVPYIKVNFIPILKRPETMGLLPQQRYSGIYVLLICIPKNTGSGDAMLLAETLLERFDATTDITIEDPVATFTTVSIDYSEAGLPYLDAPYYCLPVTIGWHIYSQ
jgi:Bacteriophage related domain of unknown function